MWRWDSKVQQSIFHITKISPYLPKNRQQLTRCRRDILTRHHSTLRLVIKESDMVGLSRMLQQSILMTEIFPYIPKNRQQLPGCRINILTRHRSTLRLVIEESDMVGLETTAKYTLHYWTFPYIAKYAENNFRRTEKNTFTRHQSTLKLVTEDSDMVGQETIARYTLHYWNFPLHTRKCRKQIPNNRADSLTRHWWTESY